jgi:putative addiction module component (TIGR02574 family)
MAARPSGFLFFSRGDAMEFQAVLDAVRAWPVDERVRLVDQIQDELETHADNVILTDDQTKEVERRIAAYDADPSIGIPWEQFEDHMDKQLKELGE